MSEWPLMEARKPLWAGSRKAETAGIMDRATVLAKRRLSVFVTLMGRVSATRPVSFF